MTNPAKYHEFENRDQWRTWLHHNHTAEKEVYLVLYKKRFSHLGLSLEEATEEALCFGWIDSTLKSLDQKRYTLRYSPRTSNSVWSISNIKRVEELIAHGKMTSAGQKKIAEAKANGQWRAAIRRELVDLIPEELEKVLQDKKGALSAYRALPNSLKKRYIYWLQSAKRDDTKRKRIRQIVKEVLNKSDE